MAVTTDQVTLTVDGQSVTVPRGTLILDAAKKLGIDIPIFCSHPKMDPVAVCRMCLVEVEKMPKLQPACAVYVMDGMVVRTRTDQVHQYQNGVLEFLLLNHPLDCPICDKGGECPLQDQTYAYGPGASRYDFPKKHFDKAVPLSDKILLDRERCILCWRCTRFSTEISGERELALVQRGKDTIIGTFNDEPARSEYQGNWTEICPVGALTSRQYRFVSRPWDLDRTATICPGCSMGCNIHADARQNRLGRFQSRENLAVDDGWLCDFGRYSFPNFQRDRIERPQVRRNGRLREVSYDEAIAAAAQALERIGPAMAGWASPAATNEELFLFQRLFRDLLGSPHLDHGAGRRQAAVDLDPDDAVLPIADLERCDYVVVLGGQAVIDAAPVLHLRLFKSQRRGVHVLKVDDARAALEAVPADAQAVGLLSTARQKPEVLGLQAKLQARVKGSVRRLLVVDGPNGRGASDLGVVPAHGPGHARLERGAGRARSDWEAAGVLGVLLFEASPLHGFEATGEEREWLARLETVVLQRSRPSPLDELAHVILPGRTFAEKGGTITSMEGRVQRIRPAIDAAAVRDDWRILQGIAQALGADWRYREPEEIFQDLAAVVPGYRADRIGERVLGSEPA